MSHFNSNVYSIIGILVFTQSAEVSSSVPDKELREKKAYILYMYKQSHSTAPIRFPFRSLLNPHLALPILAAAAAAAQSHGSDS